MKLRAEKQVNAEITREMSDTRTANSAGPAISAATALSLLAWYVFAPQCISTLSVVRRETNTWRYPLLMAAYLFALAYLAAFVTYRAALWFGA